MDTFQQVLHEICKDRDRLITNVNALSNSDRLCLESWNAVVPDTVDVCVHDLFSQKADLSPNSPAICVWDLSMTYSELDKASSALAADLRHYGDCRDRFIPFCLEKSGLTPVCILAILKAGAACVPLDPMHPLDYRTSIVEQVNAPLVIASPSQASLFQNGLVPVFVISKDRINTAGPNCNALEPALSPNADCYCIFTSGSMGAPKGVIWSHSALSSSMKYHGPALGVDSNTRSLQFGAHIFDVSVSEILTTLIMGGCVCVPHEEERLNGIESGIDRMKANWAFFTPTFAQQLDPARMTSLRTLTLGGESIGQDNVLKWSKTLRLMICYGPSETAIYCSASQASQEPNSITRADYLGQPIGCAMWLTQVKNPDRLVPVGAVGEILIEGPFLARGYLNDTERTAQSFIENPAWASKVTNSHASRRFYRTGDLARQTFSGALHFVSRNDSIVKIRGQRLELQGVEHNLTQHTTVRHAVVFYPETGPFEKQLVALVEIESSSVRSDSDQNEDFSMARDSAITLLAEIVSDIEEFALMRLPPHGVPQAILLFHHLPLTASRKLDRTAIKRWITSPQRQQEAFKARFQMSAKDVANPATQAERTIAAVWAEVLRIPVEQIGKQSSFVRLGGDSIAAMQVISRLRKLGHQLLVQDILARKTVAEIVVSFLFPVSTVKPRSEVTNTVFDLSPMQKMQFGLMGGSKRNFEQTALVSVRPGLSTEKWREAFSGIVAAQGMLRARFVRDHEEQWQQYILSFTDDVFEFQAKTAVNPEQVRRILQSTQAQLDIESGPVFAVVHIKHSGGKEYVFAAAHHLVVDLVSWEVIWSQVAAFIENGQVPQKPQVSFQAWCQLQNTYAHQHLRDDHKLNFDVPQAQYEYWGVGPMENCQSHAERLQVRLDDAQTKSILICANEAFSMEPLDLLLAAALFSFAKTFPDRTEVAMYNEGHGREPWNSELDISQTVGWFTTMVPIVLSATESLEAAVRQVKDRRRSIPNQGWNYFTSPYVQEMAASSNGHFPPEISFNFFGSMRHKHSDGALINPVKDFKMDSISINDSVPRHALIEIECVIDEGYIKLTMIFNNNMRHQSEMQTMLSNYVSGLAEIASAFPHREPEITVGDFPSLAAEGATT